MLSFCSFTGSWEKGRGEGGREVNGSEWDRWGERERRLDLCLCLCPCLCVCECEWEEPTVRSKNQRTDLRLFR